MLLFWQRQRLITWQRQLDGWSFNQLYAAVLATIDKGARAATRIQTGKLRFYLATFLLAMLGLVALTSGSAWTLPTGQGGTSGLHMQFDIIRLLALVAIVGGAVALSSLNATFCRAGAQCHGIRRSRVHDC